MPHSQTTQFMNTVFELQDSRAYVVFEDDVFCKKNNIIVLLRDD